MKLNKESCLVVLSGGQDSTICLGLALQRFPGDIQAMTFDYGQRHSIELEAAKKVVDHYQTKTGRTIRHEIAQLGEDILLGSSPLTDHNQELESYNSFVEMDKIIGDRVEKTFVPMRNALFLTLAANHAVAAGIGNLMTGVCQADNANYPDCREVFIGSMESTINLALGIDEFEIWVPLMDMTKAESIHLALGIPHAYEALKWSHTAYDGQYPPIGKDHASVLRAHGFEEAGVPDPLVVRAWQEGLMALPETQNYQLFMGLLK